MKTLRELSSEASQLATKLIESEGQLDETTETALALNEKNLALKIDAYAYVKDELKLRIERWKARKKELDQLIKTIENAIDSMDYRLEQAMEQFNTDELIGDEFRFKKQKSPKRLVIDSFNDIPMTFKTETLSYDINKDELKAALEMGETIVGAHLEQGYSIRKYARSTK